MPKSHNFYGISSETQAKIYDRKKIGNRNKLHSHESDVLSSLFRARQYWLASYTFQQPVSNIISLKTGAREVLIEYLKVSLCWYRRFIKIFHNRINFPPTFSEDLRWWKGTQVQHHWNHNFKVIWRLWKWRLLKCTACGHSDFFQYLWILNLDKKSLFRNLNFKFNSGFQKQMMTSYIYAVYLLA